MTELDAFHMAVRKLAQDVLAERGRALGQLGLRSRVEVRRAFSGGDESSELCVAFWKGDGLVDLFEDFVVREGRRVATLEELRRWLEQNVDDVLREQSEG